VTLRSLSGDLLVVPPKAVRLPESAGVETDLVGTQARTAPDAQPESVGESNPAIAAAYDEARLRILRSLERGEIDVAEAGRRLEALDGAGPLIEPVAPEMSQPVGAVGEAADDVDPGTETARFDPTDATDA
jgi:hypothetical protein